MLTTQRLVCVLVLALSCALPLACSSCTGGTSSSSSGGDSAATSAAALAAAPRAEPACEARLEASGRLLVADQETGIELERQVGSGDAQARTFALDATHVLVAVAADWRVFGSAARPDGRLWRVDCRAPHAPELVAQIAGADFGHGVLGAGGQHFFFSAADGGVALLEPVGGATPRALLRPAPLEDTERCWGAMPGLTTRDLVEGLAEDGATLVVHRGGPCGYEAEWLAHTVHVEVEPLPTALPLAADDARLEVPHPVATVVADAGGTLWLGDGGRCDEPGVIDAATPGAVWRSDDGGAHWRAVAVQDAGAAQAPERGAVRHIVADPQRVGHLVVVTALCRNGGIGPWGGTAYRTTDGGASWHRLPMPPALADAPVVQQGDGIVGIWRGGDTLEALVIEDVGGSRWQTRDGGTRWEQGKIDPKGVGDPGRAALGEVTFEARDDGLWRRDGRDGKASERVFPQSP